MVLVEEVHDASAYVDDNDSDYETDSQISETESISTVSSEDEDSKPISEETLLDRFFALKDIVSPTTRVSISRKLSTATSVFKTTSKWTGNAIWVLTTSALLVGLPLALAIEDEARIVQQEKELQMQQSGQQSVSFRSMSIPSLVVLIRYAD
jgi:import receptor subunit TOM22